MNDGDETINIVDIGKYQNRKKQDELNSIWNNLSSASHHITTKEEILTNIVLRDKIMLKLNSLNYDIEIGNNIKSYVSSIQFDNESLDSIAEKIADEIIRYKKSFLRSLKILRFPGFETKENYKGHSIILEFNE